MNSTERALIAQRWSLLQIEILPCFNDALGTLTPKLEKLIHLLELTRIEDFVHSFRDGRGRPVIERAWFAHAFVAKSVLNIVNTRALIDRLQNDRSLRRLCGFPLTKNLPSESTFSRAFAEFAEQRFQRQQKQSLQQALDVPIAAILSSASFHDNGAVIPLSQISAQRVTNLYDLMDAGYCSFEWQEYRRQLGHVPLIDHNPRGGKKEPFEPYDAERYKICSTVERTNARLKDEFGRRNVWVKGAQKVYSYLMFGILVLSADQLMRVLL